MPLVTPTPVPLFAGQLADPADRGTYGSRGREFWSYEYQVLAPGLNLLASQTNENAAYAVQMAAQAASAAGFVGNWSAQTGAASMPYSVYHDGVFWVLLQDIPDVTAEEPGVSILWAQFDEGATAAATTFDDSTADIEGQVGSAVTNVQAAIEALVTLLGGKVSRTSATGSILMPVGTTAQRDGPPVAGMTRWNTELNRGNGAHDTFNGVAWETTGWVIGSSVTLSGTSVDFTGIPAWVNEVEISVRELSTNGTSNGIFQLGTAVGFEATGYSSSGDGTSITNGMLLSITASSNSINGTACFKRGPGLSWDYVFRGAGAGSGDLRSSVGFKTMTGEVTRIRLTTAGGANTFDAGTAHIRWRK